MKIAYLLNSVSRKAGGLFEICKRLAQTTFREKEIVILGVEDEFTKTDIVEWVPLRPTVFSPVFAHSFGYARPRDISRRYVRHCACPWARTYPSFAGYRWHRRTKRPLIARMHVRPWALRNWRGKRWCARYGRTPPIAARPAFRSIRRPSNVRQDVLRNPHHSQRN